MPTPLFNGRDLAGWTSHTKTAGDDPRKAWAVRDGVIVCPGVPTGYLATVKEYADYTLTVEYRYPAGTEKANSGVLLHCQKTDRVWPHSVEAQMRNGRAGDIWLNPDDAGKLPAITIDPARFDAKDKSKRRYFRIEPAGQAEKPLGEWNRYEIACRGGSITLTVNSVKLNEATGCELVRGRIALQSEGSPVEFRRVELA